MEITGTIKHIADLQQVSERFKKQEFVLTTESAEHPQDIQFVCTQDKCSLLSSLNEGESVTVFFNLNGKEYITKQGEKKYFNSLTVWKINKTF